MIVKLLLASLAGAALASWPGLWGPSRNGTAPGGLGAARVAEAVWTRPAEGGYSEIAVHAGRAFTLELRGQDDYIVALDAATGREAWSLRVGATYPGHGGSDPGPIATPAVDGNDLFAVGPHGVLIAADAATGRERWRHDLVRAFNATPPTWGFAASPLIDGRLVIVPTGGEKSRGLLAFDRTSGALAWNAAVGQQPAYASAVPAVIGGMRQILAASSDRLFAVSPEDGKVLWNAPLAGGDIQLTNSPIPIGDDRILVLFWQEAALMRVTRTESGAWAASELWRTPRLRGANGPAVHRDGFIYGFAGDFLTCVNAETTGVAWRERTGAGTLIAVGDHLVFQAQTSGDFIVAPISPKGFVPSLRARVLEPEVLAVTGPSFSEGRFYLRNLKQIVALQLN